MKRFLSILLCAVMVLNCLAVYASASVDEEFIEDFVDDKIDVIDTNSLEINAKSAILMDAETGMVLYAKNASEALPPASVS